MNSLTTIHELNEQFSYLMAWTREIEELDMAGALSAEFRGEQAAGWSTVDTAYEVFCELGELTPPGGKLATPEWRQVLALYAQLAEAGGVYESVQNLLNVIKLKPWNLWPFQDLVRVKQNPKRVIGPNANATFRGLARAAHEIGMVRFGELLETAFRDDIRNGICHADYILAASGLRLRRRNGGDVVELPWAAVTEAINVGQAFFWLLDSHLDRARRSFSPAREIVGRLSANPPMRWLVELADGGRFSLRSNSPGSERDLAYDRQQHINALLGGKIMMAYAFSSAASAAVLLDEIRTLGFDVQLVEVPSDAELSKILAEIDTFELWRPDARRDCVGCPLLLATPGGVTWLEDLMAFRAVLPPITPLEIA